MWKPSGFFEIEKPSEGWGRSFELPAPQPQPVRSLDFQNDPEKKKAYGIELARIKANDRNAYFKAALTLFSDDTSAASWITGNWLDDPVVVAAREAYQAADKTAQPLLDKEALAAKLLECAEEKIERNGQKFYINEAKDRLGFLKLYSEVMGYTGKLVDASTTNFVNNEMRVVLVKPDDKPEAKPLEVIEDIELEETSITPLRIKAV